MSITRLRSFVQSMTRVVESNQAENALLDAARPLLA